MLSFSYVTILFVSADLGCCGNGEEHCQGEFTVG